MGATLADHAAGDSAIGDIRAEFVLPFFSVTYRLERQPPLSVSTS